MPQESENIYKVVLLAVGLLIAIIGYFFYFIHKQNKEAIQWHQDRIAAEINTLENERKRIAGDLHDELGPMLSAIKLQINHLEPETETETAVLQKSSRQIDIIIQRFREISYDLLPNTLVRKGFIKATEESIGRLKLLHPLEISFHSIPFSLTPEKEISLYRIVQEIIQNTIKHARASVLAISLEKKESMLILETKDNGVGFNYSEKSHTDKGVGLLSIQSRVELLNAFLSVNTQPGAGTHFTIEIPC